MKRIDLNVLICVACAAIAGAAAADETDPCAIKSNVLSDGTVELSNTESATRCESPPGAPNAAASAAATAMPPAAPAATAPASTPAAANVAPPAPAADSSTQGDTSKDPQQQYRDAMLQGTAGSAATNPAVSRRYKMMTKEAYQAKLLDGSIQAPQAGNSPNQ